MFGTDDAEQTERSNAVLRLKTNIPKVSYKFRGPFFRFSTSMFSIK